MLLLGGGVEVRWRLLGAERLRRLVAGEEPSGAAYREEVEFFIEFFTHFSEFFT
jgi:hypothetical protein